MARVIGLRNVLQSVEQFKRDVTKKSLRGVYKALAIAGLQAARFTPIDTSALLNSQRKEYFMFGTLVRGRLSYNTSYAEKVNDPNTPQRFRRAGAQKQFLEKGFETTQQQIEQAIRDELKI